MSRARILADYVSSGDELAVTTATADAALPKAGGAMTGAITTNSTFDGVDIAARDAIHAPKASPAFTGTATFSGDIVPSTPLSHRNMIINGDMRVAQRGTSFTGQTGANYIVDRWTQNVNGAQGTWTNGQEADAPTGSGFRNSLFMNCTAADGSPAVGDFVRVEQRFEGQDLQQIRKGTSSAKAVTVSFWAKSPNTGIHIVELEDRDNSRYCSQSYTISSANTWEEFALTFPADTTGVLNDDNGESLRVNFYLGAGATWSGGGSLGTTWHTTANTRAVGQVNVAGAIHSSNNYWQVTGVQLELGSNATPFEHRSYGEELLKCLRYYQIVPEAMHGIPAFGANSTTVKTTFPLVVPLRASPTTAVMGAGSAFGEGSAKSYSSNAPTIGKFKGNTSIIGINKDGFTNLESNHVYLFYTGSTGIKLDSEL